MDARVCYSEQDEADGGTPVWKGITLNMAIPTVRDVFDAIRKDDAFQDEMPFVSYQLLHNDKPTELLDKPPTEQLLSPATGIIRVLVTRAPSQNSMTIDRIFLKMNLKNAPPEVCLSWFVFAYMRCLLHGILSTL